MVQKRPSPSIAASSALQKTPSQRSQNQETVNVAVHLSRFLQRVYSSPVLVVIIIAASRGLVRTAPSYGIIDNKAGRCEILHKIHHKTGLKCLLLDSSAHNFTIVQHPLHGLSLIDRASLEHLDPFCTSHLESAVLSVLRHLWNLTRPTYSFPALCWAFTRRVARSMHTIRHPVTLGSSVPLWPVFSTLRIRFIHATT